MIEKMKSVCGSGRKKSFCRPLPMPSPRNPPVPRAISDCIAWNPFPQRIGLGIEEREQPVAPVRGAEDEQRRRRE